MYMVPTHPTFRTILAGFWCLAVGCAGGAKDRPPAMRDARPVQVLWREQYKGKSYSYDAAVVFENPDDFPLWVLVASRGNARLPAGGRYDVGSWPMEPVD